MMKFLKIIATPFVALWRWIKETAWVQPLLIVGCIFAIIFSIPYISQGIQNLTNGSDDELAYYKSHLLSMNGAYKGANDNEAEKFLLEIKDLEDSWTALINEETSETEKKEAKEDVDSFKNRYGEKFFFVLGKSDCEACTNISDALEYLEGHQGEYNVSNYRLYSIIADEDLSDSDDEYKIKSAFEMIRDRQAEAFDTIIQSATYGIYRENIEGSTASYDQKLETYLKDASAFEVPLVCMFDLTTEALEKNAYAISQVFFSVEGEDKIGRALEFANCWNYVGKTFGRKTA